MLLSDLIILLVLLYCLASPILFAKSWSINQKKVAFILSIPIIISFPVILGGLNIYKQLYGTALFLLGTQIVSKSVDFNRKFVFLGVLVQLVSIIFHNAMAFYSFISIISSFIKLKSRKLKAFISVIPSFICFVYFSMLSNDQDLSLAGVSSGADTRLILVTILLILFVFWQKFLPISNIYLSNLRNSVVIFGTLVVLCASISSESVIERLLFICIYLGCFFSFIGLTYSYYSSLKISYVFY